MGTYLQKDKSKHIEVKRCEKHAGNGHKHNDSAPESRSPASRLKEPPPRPKDPPSASGSSLRSSPAREVAQPRHRPAHSGGCRQLSRSHSTASPGTHSHAHNCHSAPPPVIVSQYKERGDELVAEAEAKLR